jgi:DNA-binding transcriptional ArsR family regulator
MASTSSEAIANAEMDKLVKGLREVNVTIAEIARAAGVTHRAISRRLSK